MKQVIVVNEALKLPRGKLAAQVAHASVASLMSTNSSQQKHWISAGMPKVVLAGSTEQEIMELHHKAETVNLPTHLIRDAGKTVVAPGTITCVGIGPASKQEIDKLTGHLKLLS
ncbi:MAG: peptidyl-tRNA hydrolase Pth2 [Kangiellaceae bacterium]|nr:peptidyl-tRNA hydrolase Pth2 [Kangiellaceae bacterium]